MENGTAAAVLGVKDFAERVAKDMPRVFEARGYVYGSIRTAENPAADGTLRMDICITEPERADCEIAFGCEGKHAEYLEIAANDPAELESFMAVIEDELADAYNEAHLEHLRDMDKYDALSAGLDDEGYVMSHAYPELVDEACVSGDSGEAFGEWLASPVDGCPGLHCAYQVIDSSGRLGVRLREGISAVIDGGKLPALLEQGLLNLNNGLLPMLEIKELGKYASEAAFSSELPASVISAIGDDLKSKLKDAGLDKACYAVSLKDTLVNASSVPLSRTAMLAVAKRIGAKRGILLIPASLTEMIAVADDESAVPADIAGGIAAKLAENNPDKSRVLLQDPMRYGVLDGKLCKA